MLWQGCGHGETTATHIWVVWLSPEQEAEGHVAVCRKSDWGRSVPTLPPESLSQWHNCQHGFQKEKEIKTDNKSKIKNFKQAIAGS